jgi:hypothetical protein
MPKGFTHKNERREQSCQSWRFGDGMRQKPGMTPRTTSPK